LLVTALALLAVAFPAVSRPALTEILWRGGFETGALSEWDAVQSVPGGAQVVTGRARDGVYSARFEVGPGDNPLACACGERAELVKHTGERPGTTSWWAWSAFFPTEFSVMPGRRVVFTQWHDYGSGHPAPLVVRVQSLAGVDRFALAVYGGRTANPVVREWVLGPVQRGRWYDFVAGIRWSSDGTGFVELTIDGAQVVPRTATPTLFIENGAKGVYLKQGLYRAVKWSGTTVGYIDAARRGRTREDVTS
jgi:polysaccharide lyase-like protein